MSKVIDIRSIVGEGYIEAPKPDEPSHGNPTNMFPIDITIHGLTYEILVSSDHTVYIKDLYTQKIHTIKTLISLYNTDDIALLKNNVYLLNGTNTVSVPEYFHSHITTIRVNNHRIPDDDELLDELEEFGISNSSADDMAKQLVYEPVIYYQGGKLRYTMVLEMNYNRINDMDIPVDYDFVISNCTNDPKKVLSGYFYILTDYPFPFVLEKRHEPVIDSNSNLTGIKVPFNLGTNGLYDVCEVKE